MDDIDAEEEDLEWNSVCGGIWSMFMAFRSKVVSADYNEEAVAKSLGKDKLSTSKNEWPIFGSQIDLKYPDGKKVLRFMNIPGLTKKDGSDHLRGKFIQLEELEGETQPNFLAVIMEEYFEELEKANPDSVIDRTQHQINNTSLSFVARIRCGLIESVGFYKVHNESDTTVA